MPKPILLVDDNPDDVYLSKLACDRSGIPHSLHVVRDGVEAISYLSGEGIFSDRTQHPLPALVLLDVKMPLRDGHEVLQWIRSQPQYTSLPVVMLTSSIHPDDVNRAYKSGANSYLQKDTEIHEFGQGMRLVLKYWLVLHVSGDQ